MRADNSFVSNTWILIDQQTGLHVGWYFWLRLLDEVNRSARYGNPFGLMLLDAEQRAPRRVIDEAASKVADAIRSTDLAGRLGEGRVGVILFEQDIEGSVTAEQRILERLAEHSSSAISWQTSLYCYPRDAFAISNLLTQGRTEGERRREPA
jgi:PleD family two-component response regulator